MARHPLAILLIVSLVLVIAAPLAAAASSPDSFEPTPSPTPTPGLASTWSTQTVFTDGSFGQICLESDSKDKPHITFTGANGLMYYATWGETNWRIQSVIQGATPIQLVLDLHDSPHILYKGANDLTYLASWNSLKWHYKAMPPGNRYSLALDSGGIPHVAYAVELLVRDYPPGVTNNAAMLNYASWNGSGWSLQTVDRPISRSDGVYLALDQHDSPRIMYGYDTYYPPSGGYIATVKFASWKGSAWDFQTALSNLDYFSSMILDSHNQPHFLYGIRYPHESSINSTLGYASWTGSSWKTQPVVSNTAFWSSIEADLALDSRGSPHIEFFNGSLMYATLASADWDIQTVAPDKFAYGEGPLALDSHGNPAICYWVVNIHNTTAYVSSLLYTTPTPIFSANPSPAPSASAAPSLAASVVQVWSLPTGRSTVDSPVVLDGLVYVSSGRSASGTLGLHCLNSSTGKEVWHLDRFFAAFTLSDGFVYVGGADYAPGSYSLQGVFSCLNALTGVEVWNFSAGTSLSAPIVSRGTAYVTVHDYSPSAGDQRGSIYALNASSGVVLWRFSGPSDTRFDLPVVLKGAKLYALSAAYSQGDASWYSSVYALDASTGSELWNYTTAGQFGSLVADNQRVYVSFEFVDTRNNLDAERSGGYIYQGGVLVLDASTGKLAWNHPIDSSVGAPLVVNGIVYAISGEGTIYAFDAADGRVIWQYTAGTGLGSILSVDGYLFVGSSNGVTAFNAQDGEVIWNFGAADLTGYPTHPTYADGLIYVGWNGPMFFSRVTEHNLYAIEASTGREIWNYTLPYTITSPPTFEDGIVYVGGSFVTSRSPDHESSGAVLALKPTIASLPLRSPSPIPSPSIPEFPAWIALPLGAVTVTIVFALKRKR